GSSLHSVIAQLRPAWSSLPLDHHFEVLALQYQRAVPRAIAASDEGQQVLRERSLRLAIERGESPVHRAVGDAKHFDPVRRRAVAKREIAPSDPDLLRYLAEKLVEPCVRSPECR